MCQAEDSGIPIFLFPPSNVYYIDKYMLISGDDPLISVVVTAHNSSAVLERCLGAVKGSLYHNYELVVVDDGSADGTADIAGRFTDKVITLDRPAGVNIARAAGYHKSRGDIVVNIDSDVVIAPDTLNRIVVFFKEHPDADALTGIISQKHPNKNFASQYKNFYMHYIFRHQPQRVTFLYGSIYAISKEDAEYYASDVRVCGDTLFGQQLVSRGRHIFLARDIEVEHLKYYSILSLLKNDFEVPFHWANIFMRCNGLRQVAQGGTGFAHASRRQLASIIVIAGTAVLGITRPAGLLTGYLMAALGFVWFVLNAQFFLFLQEKRGWLFAAGAVIFTIIDQLVMFSGVITGFCAFCFRSLIGGKDKKTR